jgi:hypothetical protein
MAFLLHRGSLQPSEYGRLPRSHARELTQRVDKMHAQDQKASIDFQAGLAKAVLEGIVVLAKVIAKKPSL